MIIKCSLGGVAADVSETKQDVEKLEERVENTEENVENLGRLVDENTSEIKVQTYSVNHHIYYRRFQ